MDEPFLLPVFYKNATFEFEAQLFASTYSYRIEVNVNGTAINFEKDDEGHLRAIAASPNDTNLQKTDPLLLQAIAASIENILS